MELYPLPNQQISFETMEMAARRVIEKDKSYPAESVMGLANIMREVYKDRLFAFRFQKLIFRNRGILGGAICRTGIVIVYSDNAQKYPWERVKSLLVEKVYVNSSGNHYSVSFGLIGPNGEDEGFTINGEAMRSQEFPLDRVNRTNEKYAAEMCAMYYNRVRSERIGIGLSKKDKFVLLHHDLDTDYASEILRRFHSPNGIILKYLRQTVQISKNGIVHKKGKRKTLLSIKWGEIEDIIVGLGSINPLLMFRKKPGLSPEREYFQPYGWKLDPPFADRGSVQQMHIIPLCWMEML